MSSDLLEKGYKPHEVEKRWYEFWEQEQLFAAKEKDNRKSYSIVIPPPNVTGVLHMGHALNNAMQDILCRYRRLMGDNVLWMPGTDHAGIATQNVVEKKLMKEGTDRHQLGREKFIEAVWKWREKYGSAIIGQLKRLGASCDWKRERFTMDRGLSIAVRKVFVKLYEDGLIYRGRYIINWCPRCNTALADLEVEHEEKDGNLFHIRYPYPDSSDGIIVATTRPETMLGDTAVAVNPDDERYQGLDAKEVILPLMERRIPIIRDSYVDASFGTGGLKVTPAHDPNDFEIAKRHDLPALKVIGDDGCMTDKAGKFKGLDRFECREKIVKALKEKGLLIKIEPYKHSIGHCYRCKTAVEPNFSKQWFVKAKPLAEKAILAVENNETRIIPEMWNKTYFEWMRNIKDWCVSRQIWWGHRIPAWFCKDCNEVIVAMEAPLDCPACSSKDLVQESDVLDTWFSSALWPFSTMGWPDETPLLKTFYPTSVLITGFDILFFWVARMMMMGLYFMKDVPFTDVYVHALVRDEEGKKMSKSKGNVIDPISVIDEYGADAFRFTLAAFAAQGRDIKMSEKRVEGYRHFINKIWNTARFSLMHIPKDFKPVKLPDELSVPDRWILSRMSSVVSEVSKALDAYRFNDAASTLYKFVWHELCDWHIEIIKPALYDKKGDSEKEKTISILWYLIKNTIIILHPFIPFVTEEIWHRLPGTDDSVMNASFPGTDPDYPLFPEENEAEAQMEFTMNVIAAVRNIRGEMNIAPSLELDVLINAPDIDEKRIIEKQQDVIINMAKLKSVSFHDQEEKPESSAFAVVDESTIYVPLEGIIDFSKEIERLKKAIGKIDKELLSVTKKLENEAFLNKAPESVVEKVREKRKVLSEKQEKLQENLERIKAFSI